MKMAMHISGRRAASCLGVGALLVAAGGVLAQGEPPARAGAVARDRGDLKRDALELQRAAMRAPRDAALRAAATSAIRRALAAGELHPRNVMLSGVLEVFYGAPDATSRSGVMGDAEFGLQMERVRASNPHPWAGDIAFGEDFEYAGYTPHVSLSSLSDLNPLDGQTAPNGNVWKTANTRDYNGLLDNATAQTGLDMPGGAPGSGYLGVPGGPDPLGVQGTFMASPRGSVVALTSLAIDTSYQWVARLDHTFFAATPSQPVLTIVDWYFDTLETFSWFRPVSSPEGFVIANVIMGGYDFYTLSPFTNADNILDRPIVGVFEPGYGELRHYATEHTLKTREWFQIAVRQTVDSYSIWLRDSETQGANTSGLPFDAPGYSGEIFDTEWVQLFPGFDDAVGTAWIEGAGRAALSWGLEAESIVASDGNIAGEAQFTFGVEELQVLGGQDPPAFLVPGYAPTDWYFDNYSVIGEAFVFPVVTPWPVLPYFDDFELWSPGPLGLQDDRWSDFFSYSAIDGGFNHTPGIGSDGGTPTNSLRVVNFNGAGALKQAAALELLEEHFSVKAAPADDLVHSSWFRLQDHSTTFALDLTGDGRRVGRVFFGGRDAMGVVDDRLYVWLPNPNYDPDAPEADVTSESTVWDGAGNRAFIPAPLNHSGGGAATLPEGSWFQIEARVSALAGADTGDLSLMLDGSSLEVDSAFFAGLGAAAPSMVDSAGVVLDTLTIECGYEIAGQGGRLWWDDISLDGAAVPRPTPLSIGGAPYASQEPYGLPFEDGFDGYLTEISLPGQSFTDELGRFTFDPRAFEVIPLAGAIAPGASVYRYVVDEILTGGGSLPAAIAPGATVAIANNLQVDWLVSPTSSQGYRVRMRDGAGELIGEFTCTPALTSQPTPWDGVVPVIGRYFFEYESRWIGDAAVARIEDVEGEHPGHGAAASLTQQSVFEGAVSGFSETVLRAILPDAILKPGQTAAMTLDLFIESDGDSPRGRTILQFRDAQCCPGFLQTNIHAQFVFGGPNNYLDNLNNQTLAPMPDGEPDDMAPEYASDPARLYVLRPGTLSSKDQLEDTGFDVPLNQWLQLSLTLGVALDWTLTVRDAMGAVLTTVHGTSLDSDVVEPSIGELRVLFGNDEGGAGRPGLEPIVFASLGVAAPPEGGLDPQSGTFNSIPANYFYYEITGIDNLPLVGYGALPEVTAVDLQTGAVAGTRDMQVNDIVALLNDTGTGAGSTTGVPLATLHPRNASWAFSTDNGATVDSSGTWQALGLPGLDGVFAPLPDGGIANLAPPYGDGPAYRTMLMGSVVELPAYPFATPPHRALLDNVGLEVIGCVMDLDGDGSVTGPDLAALLASWGAAGSPFDFNGDNTIDGADLAALLSAWGPCE